MRRTMTTTISQSRQENKMKVAFEPTASRTSTSANAHTLLKISVQSHFSKDSRNLLQGGVC